MHAACGVDGVLLVDKPSGPSSNQVLQSVKRLYGARKAGHAGTLDPLATGLLPILFGQATKFASFSSEASKAYDATVLLGVRTTTSDVTGEIVEQKPVQCSVQTVRSMLDRFRGSLEQIPPMYSAIKRAGQPLYRMARRGEVVDREPRPVRIDVLELYGTRGDEIDLHIECSKGTYIRVLAEDIGTELGCGATLKQLRRTRVGTFRVTDAISLDALQGMTQQERASALLALDSGLGEMPQLALSAHQAQRIRQGRTVDLERKAVTVEGVVRLYVAESGSFMGLGEICGGTLRALRLILEPEGHFAAHK
jgi:tRNA pseudouridine55 synthase